MLIANLLNWTPLVILLFGAVRGAALDRNRRDSARYAATIRAATGIGSDER